MCVRPCQQVVGPAEYGHEVARVVDFLRTGGRSLLEAIARSRDRLSEEMMFEEAARQHKRFEKVQEILKLRDELARDVERLNGVAITQSLAANAVELWFVRDGAWQGARRLDFEVQEGKPVSLDRKLRETFAAVEPRTITAASGANTWPCWRAGITPPGATANGWASRATMKSPTASW